LSLPGQQNITKSEVLSVTKCSEVCSDDQLCHCMVKFSNSDSDCHDQFYSLLTWPTDNDSTVYIYRPYS